MSGAANTNLKDLATTAFGWPADRILDLGDITTARGQELYVALWLRLMGPAGGPSFNIHLVTG